MQPKPPDLFPRVFLNLQVFEEHMIRLLEINDSKIQLPEHLNYQLFDVSGKLLQYGFENTLDISGLSKGLYLLKTPTSVHKFVKE